MQGQTSYEHRRASAFHTIGDRHAGTAEKRCNRRDSRTAQSGRIKLPGARVPLDNVVGARATPGTLGVQAGLSPRMHCECVIPGMGLHTWRLGVVLPAPTRASDRIPICRDLRVEPCRRYWMGAETTARAGRRGIVCGPPVRTCGDAARLEGPGQGGRHSAAL